MANANNTTSARRHTPGPWEIKHECGRDYKSTRIEPVQSIDPETREPLGAVVFNVGSATIILEADALLIAAAPDLLAACKEMREAMAATLRAIAMSPDGNTIAQAIGREMKALRIKSGYGVRAQQAIAKAEGR